MPKLAAINPPAGTSAAPPCSKMGALGPELATRGFPLPPRASFEPRAEYSKRTNAIRASHFRMPLLPPKAVFAITTVTDVALSAGASPVLAMRLGLSERCLDPCFVCSCGMPAGSPMISRAILSRRTYDRRCGS
jgi:hypothetical protein